MKRYFRKKRVLITGACGTVGPELEEDLFNLGLCLPSGTAMTNEDLDRVITVIRICRR